MSRTRLKDRPILLPDHIFVCHDRPAAPSCEFDRLQSVAPLARPLMVRPIWTAIALIGGILIGLLLR